MTLEDLKITEKKFTEKIIDLLRQKAHEFEAKHFERISRYYLRKAESLYKNINGPA